MPIAKYITEFIKLDIEEAINTAKSGYYNESELVSLYRNEKRPRVLVAIGSMMHDETMAKHAPALVEKGKCNTMLQMQDVAAHVNDKFERYQVVEKEATMLMLEIGLAIEYVKEQLPHGQLIKWIESNLTISRMHAHRFRQLAQVFVKSNNLKPDECLLLCDPANSKEALGDKLRQMAFDFLGDKTQAELFEQYKIKYQEPKKLTYHPPKGGEELPPGESREHLVAIHTWNELGESISRNGLTDESWAYLTTKERQGLYDIVNELATRLRKSLKH